jgi:hypothetical protein
VRVRAVHLLETRRAVWLLVICLSVAGCSSSAHNATAPTSVGVTSTAVAVCDSGVEAVRPANVPSDVVVWASGKAVVGKGALWTVRSALDVPATYRHGVWSLKFPWYTRPFGLPEGQRTAQRWSWHLPIRRQSRTGCERSLGRVDPRVLSLRMLGGDGPVRSLNASVPTSGREPVARLCRSALAEKTPDRATCAGATSSHLRLSA